MRTVNLAKLASPLNWRKLSKATKNDLPSYYVMTDTNVLPDPSEVLVKLPRGSAIVLRHPDLNTLESLCLQIIPLAHGLGLKVIVAGPLRLALKVRADGLHLSAQSAKRGRGTKKITKPGFIITAAAHSSLEITRAKNAGAQGIFLSPVFQTQSHPTANPLGHLRFLRLAAEHSGPTVNFIALGGISARRSKRIICVNVKGLAAIRAWQE